MPLTAEHRQHVDHDHTHWPGCGHNVVPHDDHDDYLHNGHVHRAHDGHWDECPVHEAARGAELEGAGSTAA